MPTTHKIIISGGTGFIGRALAEVLLAQSCELIILTRQSDPTSSLPGAEYVTYDFNNKSQIQPSSHVFEGASIFIHLAADINWRTNFSPEDYDSFQAHVVNVLHFIQTIGSSLEKVIFGSSIMVYPMVGERPFVEGRDEAPNNFYGTNKLVFEDAMTWLAKRKGIHFLSARIGQVYGPRMRVNRILLDTIEKARRGEDVYLFGDGSVATDWTYIDDVVHGLTRMIDYQGSGCFNIGSGCSTDNTILARTCIQSLNSSSTIAYLPDKVVPKRNQVLDLTKSQTELSYEPGFDFATGVSAMLANKT